MNKLNASQEFLKQATAVRSGKILKFNKGTSCLRDLVRALEVDVRAGGMTKRRFIQLRAALEKRSPKDSRKYQDTLNWLSNNYPWTRAPAPPRPRRRHLHNLLVGKGV